jgi:hypothetical protein
VLRLGEPLPRKNQEGKGLVKTIPFQVSACRLTGHLLVPNYGHFVDHVDFNPEVGFGIAARAIAMLPNVCLHFRAVFDCQ